MKKSKYWQQRFKLVEEASHKEAIKTYKEIEPSFIKAQREINAQIQVWYGRFAENNEMTLAEARKTLNANELKEFRWDVEDFIKYGKENAINQKWMKELENASAKFHITRLESLLLRNQQTMEVLFGNELDQVDQMARRIITEGYYKSIFEVQKGFGLGFNISGIDGKELNLLVSKPWAGDGKNFSSRIWQRKGQMVNDLQKELTRNLILGKAPDEAIKNLERFVDKKIKNTRNAAGRLVMTESAYFHSLSQKKAFNELDVEEYEIVATLDSRTSEICQDMDGKHFPMEDYQAGITAPPFHVYCRSTTVPYFDDEFTLGEERAARDKDGKTFYVPGDIKYKDWKDKYIDVVGDKNLLKNEIEKLYSDKLFGKNFEKYFSKNEYELGDVPNNVAVKLPITLEKINIKKADLIRILERHGEQMSFKEFLNLFSSIQSPDLITQSRRLEEDRLLIFKKIDGGKHYTEMGIIKKDNGYVIHFMKTRKRSVNSLLKKVITFYKSDDL